MTGRISFALAAVLLLLQFADCMAAATPDETSMQCCGTMPCTPATQGHDCCKTMGSADAPNMVPAARISLDAPTIVAEPLVTAEMGHVSRLPLALAPAQQGSPPELYTLHASLLI